MVDAPARDHIDRQLPGPDHERRQPVDELHRGARVARRSPEPAAIGLRLVECALRKKFQPIQGDLPERRPTPVPCNPTVQSLPPVVDTVHFGLGPDVVVLLPLQVKTPLPAMGEDLMQRRAEFLDPKHGGVQLTVRALSRVGEHLRDRRIGVLQRVEGQPALAVLVVEHPHELVGVPLVAPAGQTLRDGRGQVRVIRRPRHLAGRTQKQIEHQRDAVAFRERPNLVQAIRVERREGHLGRLARAQIEGLFPPSMAHDQLSTGPRRGQRQRQRRDHPRHLLGVSMFGEEASRAIDEEFVELGVQPFGGQAETGGCELHDLREGIRPCVPGQTNARGVDLPAVANRRIHERLGAFAVRRALRCGNERPDLRVRDRKRELPGPVHDDARHGRVQPPADAVVAGVVHGPQEMLEPLMLMPVFDALDAHDSWECRPALGFVEGRELKLARATVRSIIGLDGAIRPKC